MQIKRSLRNVSFVPLKMRTGHSEQTEALYDLYHTESSYLGTSKQPV